jgi:hypothetical protein
MNHEMYFLRASGSGASLSGDPDVRVYSMLPVDRQPT